jgi:hypothetical protein
MVGLAVCDCAGVAQLRGRALYRTETTSRVNSKVFTVEMESRARVERSEVDGRSLSSGGDESPNVVAECL